MEGLTTLNPTQFDQLRAWSIAQLLPLSAIGPSANSCATRLSNSPRDAIARLETLVLMAGFDLPVRVVLNQIASPST